LGEHIKHTLVQGWTNIFFGGSHCKLCCYRWPHILHSSHFRL